ncbi:MAG: DUF3368 domain-containing protein [Blastocatellia bacterium]
MIAPYSTRRRLSLFAKAGRRICCRNSLLKLSCRAQSGKKQRLEILPTLPGGNSARWPGSSGAILSLIVLAKRRGLIARITPGLEALRDAGLWLSDKLIGQLKRQEGE